MRHINYLTYRLLTALCVAFGVSVVTYGLVFLTPGDPANVILRQQLDRQPSAAEIEAFRTEHGLEDPVPIQYANWLTDIVRGDFGTSYYSDTPVSTLILEAVPFTLELAVAGMVVALAIAVPTGVLSAVYRGTSIDYASQLGALLGVSMPNFWLGYLLILVFALTLGITPVAGAGSYDRLILPAITLGTGMAAILTRLVRASMLEVLEAGYVDAARSRGLRERIVVYKHALRNALVPVVTVLGLQLGSLLNGAVVVEIVFQRPGLGTLLVDAVFDRNYPVVQGIALFTAVVFVVTNLFVDLAYHYLDPRVALGGETR
ncbi:nickel ABC transporter permease [Natronobacterium gregoryi]|uniref:ABC transporter permease n=2 Tax=Natronobacterium gregoryi TaxID=44930 RepID=L0AGE6_NATGS|nr:nickel ABC transporter permease [Natronobacterium gregoryi]AFZ72896.1 ABC-type dipeptide/oligopeptide/nickel transport system, permease component [Natronobacterium gregoryi SP2]ELY69677.1 binding-protein-dependent transport systems inner membrane component [Natronobacterium gregoryi SP2]PLK21876.1 ABC transporter permease [Natronobacterium gregoryi SP2]SFI66713.1 peptide/nickel transport system permease protein [Natronobacterium gregoryi]